MSVEILSRIQFGVTIGLHYLFPITTLGLTLFVLLFETGAYFRRNERCRQASAFLTNLLGLVFVGGVATGLLLPVEIGANWARFSRLAGPVFGPMLSLEAMLAFALESAFLSVLVFGRRKVSPRMLWFAALCVFIGSHLSAVLIVAANSWLQTPAGHVMEQGQAVLVSLRAAMLNPSSVLRILHVLTAAWLTGAFLLCGIAAWFVVRRKQAALARTLFALALPVALVAAIAQPVVGHFHIMNAAEHAPEKVAACEGVFQTVNGAPLYLFGIPDAAHQTIHAGVYAPGALSFLESGNFHSEVAGLDRIPRENWPPVNVVFTMFHVMVPLGILMIGIAGVGVLLLWRRKLEEARWFLLLLPWVTLFPYIANEAGWIVAEMGRQPWVVRGVLRTADAVSPTLPAWQVAVSLGVITAAYLTIVLLTFVFARRLLAREAAGAGEVHA